MAATVIRAKHVPTLALSIRAAVARTAVQSVLELTLAFLLVTQVALTAAIALPTVLLFASSAALLVVVTVSRDVGRAGRALEMANVVFLIALLLAAALSR